MFPRGSGGSGGGHCCCSMRPIPRHITALYTTMVLSFVIMFHAALVGADVLVYSQDTRHPVEGMEFPDAPAHFGGQIPMDGIKGLLVYANPEDACNEVDGPPRRKFFAVKWIVLIKRYGCKFEDKVRNAENAGYDAAIIHNVNSSSLEPMSADHLTNITIPSVFIAEEPGLTIKKHYQYIKGYYIFINDNLPFNINTHLLLPFAIVVGICFTVMMVFMIVKCVKDRLHARRHRLPSSSLKKIPVIKFKKNDPSMSFETCAICLEDYLDGDKLRVLPCAHAYHCKCIDPWLTCNRRVCPMCKRKVFASDERVPSDDDDDDDYGRAPRAEASQNRASAIVPSDTSEDERAPLISGGASQAGQSRRGNRRGGGTFQTQRENPFQRASRQSFNPFARRESVEPTWAADSSSAYSTSSSGTSADPPSPPANASSDESHIQVTEAAPADNVLDSAGPNSSSPRMSVNSRSEEVQDVAVLPQDQPNDRRDRSWWWSLWSMVVDV